MADYRLPVDDDGVKYHGVVDDDGQYPGQVLYGVDENGDYRPVNVDKDGNVLTKVTGSSVGYSNDTKPTGKKGETFLELDTLDVYVNDGTKWVKIT